MWGEFWSTFGAVGLALLITCTVLNVIASLILARKSLPRALSIELNSLQAEVSEALIKVRAIEAQVTTWRAEIEGLIEESGNQFERLERKRASASAAASARRRAAAMDRKPAIRQARAATSECCGFESRRGPRG